jgi:hypothetical protein
MTILLNPQYLSAARLHAEGTIIRAMPTNIPSRDEGTLMVPALPESASASEVQRLPVRNVLEHVGRNTMWASTILKISRQRFDRILRSGKPPVRPGMKWTHATFARCQNRHEFTVPLLLLAKM